MLEELFSSAARVKALTLFLTNPENRYYLRQVCRLADLPVSAVQRELKKFLALGLLAKEISGNRTYYKVNKAFPIYKELKDIILKTTGIGEVLAKLIARSKEINVAFIYGSYAEGREKRGSDIDLFVIGGINSRKLQGVIASASGRLGREISPALYSPEEYKRKKREKNHFILSLFSRPKIFLKGSQNDL